MKIKKLEVCGFKSFVDQATLHFDHDVTCIVGPNGCGKSNVVDAIRWVMGEQSAKNLRGRAMDDVIFAGTESRGPHSFAEVTITFDNSDHLAPPEYNAFNEIAVTRRLDRSGNSDYLINKTVVRLLDVTNLFLGTGVGRRAYSIIEQGRIGLIVTAKPQDRRMLIEEAAGITKFKAKKQAAERKMEQTQQNLLRVNDIIEEIQKTLASLKRQAQKAERYKRYREEIRDLELWLGAHRFLELHVTHNVLVKQMDHAVATAEGARAALRVREAELEAERVTLQSLESVVDKAQTKAYAADNAVRLLESQLAHHTQQLEQMREREASGQRELERLATQRQELAVESETLSQQLEALADSEAAEAERLEEETAELERQRASSEEAERALRAVRDQVSEADRRIARADAMLAGFDQRRNDTRARLGRIEAEREELAQKSIDAQQEAAELRARLEGLRSSQDAIGQAKEELEEELRNLRQDIVHSDETVERLRSQLAQKRSRLHSLEEIQQRFEGVGAGVRAIMTQYGREHGASKVQGLVADRFECPPELTKALAAALGERLQYVVVDDLTTGVDAVRYLSEGKRGRATLIPSVPLVGEHEQQLRAAQTAIEQPGVIGPLLGLVRTSSEDRVLSEHMLGDVLVVESLDVARELHDRALGYGMLVTRDGQVLYADGRLSGGDGDDAGAHLIEVKREMRSLRDEVAQLDAEMSAAMARHGSLRSAIAQRQAALEATRSDAHDKEIALVKAEKDLHRAQEAERAALSRVETLSAEAQELSRVLTGESDEEALGRSERSEAQAARSAAEEQLAAAEEVYRSRRLAVEEKSAIVTEVRVRAAQAKQRLASDRAVVERLGRSMEELALRGERLTEELAQLARQQTDVREREGTDRAQLESRVAEAVTAQSEASQLRGDYETARAALTELEQALRQVRSSIESDMQEASTLTIKEREVALALTHLLEGIHQKHRVDVRLELINYHDRALPDEATKARIDELTSVVERMGEINLTAIEEYAERNQRYEYLAAQKDDLEQALGQLDQAIRQMNRQSRKLFRETFDEVNARFQQMFPRMFGGGRAELRLTDAENLLETGIDIIAMPPGKKLTSIELMSGGEKALTAVSLIFAIFQYKPSPFCLLDEVDAPLDEANIERYCEMIRSMTGRSQFILISHSKTTMESADVLYGVTMETPGMSKIVSVELRDRSESRRAPTVGDEDEAAVA
ncbi:MAG TPA: chromosome segregation protein SMC [Polyangiales bacterium]|nr:chromosome segregation protein SMC [Polyangiales bacterium]